MNLAAAPYLSGNLEYHLAFHCAPVMAGIKAANLIALNKRRFHNLAVERALLSKALAKHGIRIFPLTECSKRALWLVYRPRLLHRHVSSRETRLFLQSEGYDAGPVDLDAMLTTLRRRVESTKDYPHEIGVFLGYPLQDVKGFIENKGGNCKLCGYWKVYGDTQSAKQLFTTYDTVRDYFCRRVLCGEKIHTIQYGGQYA